MIEALIIACYVAALFAAAAYAFVRPTGVYWRSAAGVAAAAIAGAIVWQLASPSAEAGFGAFALWIAIVLLSAIIAIVACLAATLRHALNALGARAI